MRTILLVDDDPLLIIFLKMKLVEAGFKVLEANNGREALSKINRQIPDIIVADIKMPEMDGIEFHNRLNLSPETAEIPIIFLSADTDVKKQLKCLKAGAYDFVCKPFKFDHLMDRIEDALERFGKVDGYDSDSVFSGQLAGLDWTNIVQFLEWNRKTGELVFRDNKKSKIGSLCFHKGALVNAKTLRFEGEEAFFALWGQAEGTFEFYSREADFPVNIKKSNTALLFKAASLDDDYKELVSGLPRSNPSLSLKTNTMPSELIDKFGEEPLYEIVSMIAVKDPVKKIFNSSSLSRIHAGSILRNLLKHNYITFDN